MSQLTTFNDQAGNNGQLPLDSLKINNTRLTLLYAVLPDYQNEFSHYDLSDNEYWNERTDEIWQAGFLDEIDVSSATGRTSKKGQQTTSEQRFDIRVKAFDFLSNMFNENALSPISFKNLRIGRRSYSPLKEIFDYQEEHIFNTVCKKKPIKVSISVSDFEQKDDILEDAKYLTSFNKYKKVKPLRKRKVSKANRKNTSYKITQKHERLNLIKSSLESDWNFSSNQVNKPSCRKISVSKRSINSLKNIDQGCDLLKPTNPSRPITKKLNSRKNLKSISYLSSDLRELVKSLEEISTEMESSEANH